MGFEKVAECFLIETWHGERSNTNPIKMTKILTETSSQHKTRNIVTYFGSHVVYCVVHPLGHVVGDAFLPVSSLTSFTGTVLRLACTADLLRELEKRGSVLLEKNIW